MDVSFHCALHLFLDIPSDNFHSERLDHDFTLPPEKLQGLIIDQERDKRCSSWLLGQLLQVSATQLFWF